jgi:hypothetical protein
MLGSNRTHDGKVFCSFKDCKEYAVDALGDHYCDKIVIGMFYMDPNSEEMLITKVETMGFPGDRKNINQLELFELH